MNPALLHETVSFLGRPAGLRQNFLLAPRQLLKKAHTACVRQSLNAPRRKGAASGVTFPEGSRTELLPFLMGHCAAPKCGDASLALFQPSHSGCGSCLRPVAAVARLLRATRSFG